jgi:predicted DNA-binding protein (MmcQ/YjbR family)
VEVDVGMLERVEAVALGFPEAERVDVEAWGDHPTFRVRGKNFVFASGDGLHLSVKLDKEEAAAVVATDDRVEPGGYGLGRHGWIGITLPDREPTDDEWAELGEWIETSYRLVAPKTLVRRVDEPDG